MAGIHTATLYGGFNAMVATGGTISDITVSGRRWRLHAFLDSGTFTVTNVGSLNGYVERLVIGGGGGGGWQSFKPEAGACGGGGAGDHLEDTTNLTAQAYPVVVGAGGRLNRNGEPSSFAGLIAIGGGKGGRYGAIPDIDGGSGASGGGAGQTGEGETALGGEATGAGFDGGGCVIPPGYETGGGGGGGGAGGAGEAANGSPSPFNGGDGGIGKASSITGTSVVRAAGGGGAGCNRSSESGTGNGLPGLGGSGIGGNGAAWEFGPAATNPVENTGSGGGGSVGVDWPGTKGAKGVVYIRYPLDPA